MFFSGISKDKQTRNVYVKQNNIRVSSRRLSKASMAESMYGLYLAGTVKDGGRILRTFRATNTK